jgi:SPP1 family phage portal protein
LQKRIVRMAATFLCGNPIELGCTPLTDVEKGLLKVIQKSWDDCKLDYESKRLAKIMMSETEVAELWYVEKTAEPTFWNGTLNAGRPYKLRMKILANKFGDELHPVFNKAGDMIAFARGYKVNIDVGKTEEHFDIYMADAYYLGTQVSGESGWIMEKVENFTDKIPVVYYSQEVPEWYDVQRLITRLELLISNHSDINDYNGSPITVVEGRIIGFAKKGESGKLLEVSPGAKVSQLVWNAAPESIKMEYDNLRSLIHDLSSTPDISFANMSKLGNYSGIALKMLFLDAHMKAAEHEEDFGIGMQRRINFMKEAMVTINDKLRIAVSMTIKPVFKYYLPRNDKEEVENLSVAVGGKAFLSTETAVELSGLTSDGKAEFQKIKDEGLNDTMTQQL